MLGLQLVSLLAFIVAGCQISTAQALISMTAPQAPPSLEADGSGPEPLGGLWKAEGERVSCTLVLALRAGARGLAIDPMGACSHEPLRAAAEWRYVFPHIELLNRNGAVLAVYEREGHDRLHPIASSGAFPRLVRAPMY